MWAAVKGSPLPPWVYYQILLIVSQFFLILSCPEINWCFLLWNATTFSYVIPLWYLINATISSLYGLPPPKATQTQCPVEFPVS